MRFLRTLIIIIIIEKKEQNETHLLNKGQVNQTKYEV